MNKKIRTPDVMETPGANTENIDYGTCIVKDSKTIQDEQIINKIFIEISPTELNSLFPCPSMLDRIIEAIHPIDFCKAANVEHPKQSHFIIYTREAIVSTASSIGSGFGYFDGKAHYYDGKRWKGFEETVLMRFICDACSRAGVGYNTANEKKFIDTFIDSLPLAALFRKDKDDMRLNLDNGTLVFKSGKSMLVPHSADDMFTYCLPFAYEPGAEAPMFQNYLNEVLPEEEQLICAEFFGWALDTTDRYHLEKALILHGDGSNGKSVMHEIVSAVFGRDNITSYSLEALTDKSGQHRAGIENKLLNYSSEISKEITSSYFKQLVSHEPIEIKEVYKQPRIMTQYAKLAFNTNELPHARDCSHAYFRRCLIIKFDKTIPEAKQDRQLAKKIIATEMPGVMNWILSGLARIEQNRIFTYSPKAAKELEKYREACDSVMTFLNEGGYQRDSTGTLLSELYNRYLSFCSDEGCKPCGRRKFGERLVKAGYTSRKISSGIIYDLTTESNENF